MAESNTPTPNGQHPEPRSGDDAAQDMAAIFGSWKKADPLATAPADRLAKTSRNRRPLVGILAVAGVAAMVTAGVLTGQGAPGVRGELSAPRTEYHAAAPIPRSVPRSTTAVEPQPVVEPAATEPLAAAHPPADRPAAEPTVPVSATAPVGRSGTETRALAIAQSPPRVVQQKPTAPPVFPARRRDCSDGAECLQLELYAADRDLRGAYEDATTAGVSARDLRDYRNEWVRARGLVQDRPREALRIYGMIASDLRVFADEASAKADGDRR